MDIDDDDQSAVRAPLRGNNFGFKTMSQPDCSAGSKAPQIRGLSTAQHAVSIFILPGAATRHE
jgi:hypothetical protein